MCFLLLACPNFCPGPNRPKHDSALSFFRFLPWRREVGVNATNKAAATPLAFRAFVLTAGRTRPQLLVFVRSVFLPGPTRPQPLAFRPAQTGHNSPGRAVQVWLFGFFHRPRCGPTPLAARLVLALLLFLVPRFPEFGLTLGHMSGASYDASASQRSAEKRAYRSVSRK